VLKVPTAQASQEELLTRAANVPWGHDVQLVAPVLTSE